MYMSLFHEYIALRATTYSVVVVYKYSYLSKKINYLCLDKGTEGKHNRIYDEQIFVLTIMRQTHDRCLVKGNDISVRQTINSRYIFCNLNDWNNFTVLR